MKPTPAITLHQPWADLVAVGVKRIETRNWRTTHRGLVYIHAGKREPDADWLIQERPAVMQALAADPEAALKMRLRVAGVFNTALWFAHMPLGAIVAVARLSGCVPTESIYPAPSEDPEYRFGNYEAGRWAWKLDEIQMLTEPVRCIGQRKLWMPSAALDALIQAQLFRQRQAIQQTQGVSA